MKKILVTGALGQIGSELTGALRERYGAEQVIATDIRDGDVEYFERLDCTDYEQLERCAKTHHIGTIYHLAALLSARAEANPQLAWQINMQSVCNVLELAWEHNCAVFVPSSIGAFGPSTPREATPQDTIQRPSTMYGVTKVAAELLSDYYHTRFGVDTRGLRFPGLISHRTPPGGGTTDYAVEIFYQALQEGSYNCFLRGDTQLDMMYMPDAIRATISLMETDPKKLKHRNAFNITAMTCTPETLAAEIRKHLPNFEIDYQIDPVRQQIADSWPRSVDDSAARQEWGWQPEYDLAGMTKDMLEQLSHKLSSAPKEKVKG